MLNSFLTRIFGSRNERVLRQLGKTVAKINALEPEYQVLSDDELRAKTAHFRERIASGATLDSLLPEAFATVREASRRVLGLRHYDVQMIGGVVLRCCCSGGGCAVASSRRACWDGPGGETR